MDYWLVTPCFFDVPSLKKLIQETNGGHFTPTPIKWVVVDDSAGRDPEMSTLDSALKVVRPPFNLGNQRAMSYALRKIGPELKDDDLIFLMDSDGEDSPLDLPRLLEAIRPIEDPFAVVLAWRTQRKDSLWFRAHYQFYRLFFRLLTGRVVRSGNFAVMKGAFVKTHLIHPLFDFCFSSAVVALTPRPHYVPCARTKRYFGKSKMNFVKLFIHGLRTLIPFADQIFVRLTVFFLGIFVLGIVFAGVIVWIRLFTELAIPGWATMSTLLWLVLSLIAIGNCAVLFFITTQSRALSVEGVERWERS